MYQGGFSASYEIIREIGSGGMGSVFLVRDLRTQKELALKTIKAMYKNDQELKRRFCREVRALGNLEHPNIIRIYTYDINSELPWFVMEYCEAGTLLDVLRKSNLHSALNYLAQACSGVEHAHLKGVLHRDIKPGNMLIGNDGLLKVSDFGLSVFVNRDTTPLTTTNGGLGTYGFMSPEQLAHAKYVTEASDVYSLGVTCFYILTGELPGSPGFRPPTLFDGLIKYQEDRVFELLDRCLERDIKNRPSVAALSRALQNIADFSRGEISISRDRDPESIVLRVIELDRIILDDHIAILRQIKDGDVDKFSVHSEEIHPLDILQEEGLVSFEKDDAFGAGVFLISRLAITSLGLAFLRFVDQKNRATKKV